MAPRGKIQRAHFNYFCDLMQQIEWDLHHEILEAQCVPAHWHQIARARGQAPKERLTLRVDGDVVRFFRKFGRGYQQRMNDVLAAWMHGRLAGLIGGADTEDNYCQFDEDGRPRIGDSDLIDRGLVRRADGQLFDLDEGEVLE